MTTKLLVSVQCRGPVVFVTADCKLENYKIFSITIICKKQCANADTSTFFFFFFFFFYRNLTTCTITCESSMNNALRRLLLELFVNK